ncbi:MAG: proton-conducting transporter membrane subunit, partial [Chloroflexota bacterium]|nr:proton-conducting transporter membrane subunit [Chloroflexota bacterium]
MVEGYNGLLTATVFLPAVGALVLLLLVKGDKNVRNFAALIALADMVLSLIVFGYFDRGYGADRFQFVDQITWIPDVGLNAEFLLTVDGLSAPLVALTGLLGMCAVLASWHVGMRVKEYFIWLLVLQTAVMGVFTSMDLLLFFLFWELELVPMFMLISVWGSGRKEYSAMKFLIFTILGSAFMLVGIVAVYLTPDVGTFNMVELSSKSTMLTSAGLLIPMSGLFWLFFAGFAIKLPTWPVHTWLPDAHTDAPTAASVMLAGVLLKMGGYG